MTTYYYREVIRATLLCSRGTAPARKKISFVGWTTTSFLSNICDNLLMGFDGWMSFIMGIHIRMDTVLERFKRVFKYNQNFK